MVLVAAITTLVVAAFAVPLALLIRHTVYEDAVQRLELTAGDVARYVHGEERTPTKADIGRYLSTLQSGQAVSVELPDHSVLGTLPPGGLAGLPSGPSADRTGHEPDAGHDETGGPPHPTGGGYRGGRLVQLAVGGGTASSTVRVYATDSQLHSGETGWWLLLVGASLGLLFVGIVGAELLTRRIVRPLTDTAATARALSAGDTTARAPTDGPREVAEVGASINRLADRIDELIAEERETVADLSHRMRTPLTALRLDAEALADPADAERVSNHVSELERTLTAVIRAARRPEREGRMPSCDASGVVGERVAFWSALAEDQERPSTVALPDHPLPVRASAADLVAAVDALLENVFAHTPEGTAFDVRLTATPVGALLEVSDEGPGLPPEAPVRGRSDRGSSGLGLDIARRCAETSGGSMTLGASRSGGAVVSLDLRAP